MSFSELKNDEKMNSLKQRASRWALFSNTILLIIKFCVWGATGSIAVFAEIINSGADLLGSIIIFFSIRVSVEPPDESHSYGHGKLENLSSSLIAFLILSGGGYAIYEAIHQLTHKGEGLANIGWALLVMAVSTVINIIVSQNILRVAKITESPALAADGHHLRTDIMTSIGVFTGLLLVMITHNRIWDSIAALCVSILILKIGFELGIDALLTLSDRALPNTERELLENVLKGHPSVMGYHNLRTRKSGSNRYADVHVLMADDSTLVEAHRLAEEIEDKMREALPNLDPMVHPEPHDEEMAHQHEKHAEKDAWSRNDQT